MEALSNVTPVNDCTAPAEPGEEWRLITDPRLVPSRYYVSNLGRIFDGSLNAIKSQHQDRDGYKKVTLRCVDHTGLPIPVHRLVAFAFLDAPSPEQIVIDHINGKPWDNRSENLKWCTQKENINNPLSIRHRREASIKRGRNRQRRIMCWETGEKFDSIKEAVEEYGVSSNTISKSCRSGIIPEPGTETIIGGHIVRHFCYIDANGNPIPMARRVAAHRNQPIRCSDTGVCYGTVAEAANKTGIRYNTIRRSLRRKTPYVKPLITKLGKPVYHFEWITKQMYEEWLAKEAAKEQTQQER